METDHFQLDLRQEQSKNKTEFSLSDVKDVLWTVSERCNFNCTYCEVIPKIKKHRYDPTRKEVDRIIEQLCSLNLDSIILSGGEALLSQHIGYIFENALKIAPTQYLITNGTVLGSYQKKLLEKYYPRTMVTIDSLYDDINSLTRGSNKLVRSIESIKWLLEAEIFTIVIIVLTSYNIKTIYKTIQGLYDIGVRNILIQQLHCSTNKMRGRFMKMLPSVFYIKELYFWLEEFRKDHPEFQVDDNEICFFENRIKEKQNKCLPDKEYLPMRMFMCGAGYNFFALKTNGDVIPCNAFLDIPIGNLHKDEIKTILEESPIMKGLRNLRSHRVDEIPGCKDCDLTPICDGGCRADTFNLTGEIGSPHPCCARLRNFYDPLN